MKKDAPQRTVAVLLFEGVELLDFAGAADVFIVAADGRAFRVVTVAPSADPLRTMGGLTVKPDVSFQDAPKADIIIVPGGHMRNIPPSGLDWLQEASGDAQITMSVCMGAFVLARAGLLDGIEATTHHWGIDNLRKAAPKCRVVTGPRYVDAGRIITTAGVTAGIDGALHVVERFLGPDVACWIAEEWLEHRPAHSPSASAPDTTGRNERAS